MKRPEGSKRTGAKAAKRLDRSDLVVKELAVVRSTRDPSDGCPTPPRGL